MAKPTGSTRDIAIETPLAQDTLLFESMTGEEHLSELFGFKITLLSSDRGIQGSKLLGENVTVRLRTFNEKTPRYFNGYVTEFTQLPESTPDFARYQILVRPWLWFLTCTSDCRIFQNQKIPDIIKAVFRGHGFSDFEEKLQSEYREWEYCVQYRETDFNFVSRLMEQEGLYYFFRHEDGKHTLVIADGKDAHEPVTGYEEVPYYLPDAGARRQRDHLWYWVPTQQVRSGKIALSSFDFKAPGKSLRANGSEIRKHSQAEFEIYDYPGDYTEAPDGQKYADLRMEEIACAFETIEGAGDARGLASGATFKLTNFAREDQNREYLVVGVSHVLNVDDYQSGGGTGEMQYECSVKVIDAKQQFRAPLATPKPEIRGPQTAIVVGASSEEITTDEFGRVKVKFHWDRHAKGDDTSSCWIRVSQAVAGQNWGGIFLPRVGQEVIVEYIEGDPDLPIITGRVYNGDNKPPYALPERKTVSALKSNSSKGGAGFNEIRFEDLKGEEQIFIHAEHNLDIRVKNSRFETIDQDRHLKVLNDKFEEVQNKRHEKVGADHIEAIEKDRHLHVKGLEAKQVEKSLSLSVGGDVAEEFMGNHSQTVSKDLYVKATNIVIEASSNITIKVGQSSIAIDSSGIKVKNASGTVALEGMQFEAKGTATAKLEGKMTDVKGDAMLIVKGGLVKIN